MTLTMYCTHLWLCHKRESLNWFVPSASHENYPQTEKSLGSINNEKKLSQARIHTYLYYILYVHTQFDSIAIEFESVQFSCGSLDMCFFFVVVVLLLLLLLFQYFLFFAVSSAFHFISMIYMMRDSVHFNRTTERLQW